jgi:hypothetical protein
MVSRAVSSRSKLNFDFLKERLYISRIEDDCRLHLFPGKANIPVRDQLGEAGRLP